MKFLVDAQLPRRLAVWLCNQGHDAIHTLNLPSRNTTSDADVITTADREERIVVTKDADFVESFLLSGRPQRLWLISTGNISNSELETLIRANFPVLIRALSSARFVELSRDFMTVRE